MATILPPQVSNNYVTTLSTALTTSGTSLTLATSTGAPLAPPFQLKIESEIVRVTAGGAGVAFPWTIQRASEGPGGAAAHSSGVEVANVFTAGDIRRWITEYVMLPRHYGFQAWTIDPGMCDGDAAIDEGQLVFAWARIPEPMTLTTIHTHLPTAGSGSTANCYMGVWSSAGTRLGYTASDQQTAFESSGAKSFTLTEQTAGSLTLTGGVGVYVLLGVLVGTQGSTSVTIAQGGSSASAMNTGLSEVGVALRAGKYSSGLSSLPTTLTLSEANQTTRLLPFMAVS